MFASYFLRIWRRKATALCILAAVALFLLSATTSSVFRTKLKEEPKFENSQFSENAFRGRKKLDDSSKNFHAVQFIPGVPDNKIPQPINNKLTAQLPDVKESDVKVYQHAEKLAKIRLKNQQLYEQEAARAASNQKIAFPRRRGDVQPVKDYGNVEYRQQDSQQSLFRSDFGEAPPPYYRPKSPPTEPPSLSQAPYIPKRRLVHFDLKGAPPKIDYLIKVLDLIVKLGGTGVLLEYEDMFPFHGELEETAAGNHYSRDDVLRLLDAIYERKLEAIPLIQTFGHLEFILKLPKFAYLRDNPTMPESICPCHNDTGHLIRAHIDQVLGLHVEAAKKAGAKLDFVHIGCDEVYHLGECEPCQGMTRTDVFVAHVSRVAKYVRDFYPGVKPIIWDDMLRNMMPIEMEPLAELVQPMVWVYAYDVPRFMPTFTWDTFSKVFPTAWAASAFKGANGPTLTAPPVKRHLDNNLSWLMVMRGEEKKFQSKQFEGIVITGWQRYDHFAVLAELLPVGIPSLALDLLAAKHGYLNLSDTTHIGEFFSALDCVGTPRNLAQTPIDLDADPYLYERAGWCYFPGDAVFKMTRTLLDIEKDVAAFVKAAKKDKGWTTDYNVRHKYSSPFRINEIFEEFVYVQRSAMNLVTTAKKALSDVFDEFTVSEWIEQKIWPLIKQLRDLRAEADSMQDRKTWPRRPLPHMPELREFGIGIPEGPKKKSLKFDDDDKSSNDNHLNNAVPSASNFGDAYQLHHQELAQEVASQVQNSNSQVKHQVLQPVVRDKNGLVYQSAKSKVVYQGAGAAAKRSVGGSAEGDLGPMSQNKMVLALAEQGETDTEDFHPQKNRRTFVVEDFDKKSGKRKIVQSPDLYRHPESTFIEKV